MKYIALLRGVNVGGNNKVSMGALKECFVLMGFEAVTTYINSGNIFFSGPKRSQAVLIERCEKAIEAAFGFRVVCMVIEANELKVALSHAPEWWDKNPADKHNALFVIPPATPETIMHEVGEAKPEYEKIAAYGQVIFWTAPLKTFSRTRYSKIVGTAAYQFITIRNANTTKKLAVLCS